MHEQPDGTIDGYVSYRIKQDWDFSIPGGEVRARDCVAADPEVEAALLAYLADIDLTATITSWMRPVEDPFALRLADWRRYKVEMVHDHLWVRILDVPAALSARRYESPGTLVLAVDDAFRPATSGRYRLDGGRRRQRHLRAGRRHRRRRRRPPARRRRARLALPRRR